MAIDVRERLSEATLIADGAMGTQLSVRGASFGRSFDELNLLEPELVTTVHRDFVAAGADLLLTNTFCATPLHLDRWGLADRAAEINRAGVAVARRAGGADVLLAGSVGPSASPTATSTGGASRLTGESFGIQIEALLEGGVDLLWFETFSDLDELEIAIVAARQRSDVPIVASVTFTRDGYTVHGATPEQAARRLAGLGVDGIGVNCSTGPLAVTHVAERYRETLGDEGNGGPFIAAMPNAGFPDLRGGRIYYPASPDYFATSTVRLREIGCRIIGGCCGTTPAHVAAMRSAIDTAPRTKSPPSTRSAVAIASPTVGLAEQATSATPERVRSAFGTALATGQFVVTVEMEPPRSADTTELEASARILRQAGATVLDISDIPMARLRMTGLAAASRVQASTGLETVLHFPVRGRNLLRIQGDLLAAHALGVRNLFATMGDPAVIGDYPQAFDHHDIVPTALIRLIKEQFNRGVDAAGSSVGAPCEFVVGAAASLTPFDVDHEIRLLRRKIDSGADFLLTQPVFDAAAALEFLDRYTDRHGPLGIPLLVGLLPLATARHANFLNNEVPGMSLPPAALDIMTGAGDHAAEAGLRICLDVATAMRDRIAGVYVIPAFKRYRTVAQLIERLRAAD